MRSELLFVMRLHLKSIIRARRILSHIHRRFRSVLFLLSVDPENWFVLPVLYLETIKLWKGCGMLGNLNLSFYQPALLLSLTATVGLAYQDEAFFLIHAVFFRRGAFTKAVLSAFIATVGGSIMDVHITVHWIAMVLRTDLVVHVEQYLQV